MLTPEEARAAVLQRRRRKNTYHLSASLCSRHFDTQDEEPDFYASILNKFTGMKVRKSRSRVVSKRRLAIDKAKQDLVAALASSGGDPKKNKDFQSALKQLQRWNPPKSFDASRSPSPYCHDPPRNKSSMPKLEGMWMTMSKPNFADQIGTNDNEEFLYTLGRMSFDMFRPTHLVCSLQGTFNDVSVVSDQERAATKIHAPKKLREEVQNGTSVLRRYDIVTAFTIEPENPASEEDSHGSMTHSNKGITRPIKGIMTTHGYVLPDPVIKNRLSIWFTGGSLEVNDDDVDLQEWARIFTPSNLPKRQLKQRAKLFAARALMGATPAGAMQSDGSISYEFKRPLGGHGSTYIDVLYIDDTLRVAEGNRGGLYVFVRIPRVESPTNP